MPGGVLVRDDRQRNSTGIGDGPSRLDGVTPRGGTPRSPPAGTLTLAGQHNGNPLWLARQKCGNGGQLVLGRATLNHRARRMRMPIPRFGPIHKTHLKERKVIRTSAHVASHRGEQTRQQRRAKLRLFV
jgi:hypothetical protein